MYDREPNFEDSFKVGDRLVLTDAQFIGTINTRFGAAEKSLLTVVTRDSYPTRVTYSALGAGFANLARRATRADFPHVAEYILVDLGDGKAVKRFAPVYADGSDELLSPRAWVEGDDGRPVDAGAFAPTGGGTSATPDDIPF